MLLPRSWRRYGWSSGRLLLAFALVGAAFAITWDAWRDILHIALRDEESSHIFLVPIVATWLFWVRRRRLRHLRPQTSFLGPACVLCGWALYSFGDTYLIQSFFHAGAIILVVGCLLTVLGRKLLIEFLPVFLTLAFLIPIPGRLRQQIAIPLQTVTAEVAAQIFEFLGAPIARVGNTLSVNGVDVQIAEACNGLRMMFALALASFAFAFGTPLRWYTRFLIVAATPVSAILCNVVRLIPTVWLYGYYPGDVAVRFHDFSGWVMLVVSFLILLGIVRLLRWALVPVAEYTLAYD